MFFGDFFVQNEPEQQMLMLVGFLLKAGVIKEALKRIIKLQSVRLYLYVYTLMICNSFKRVAPYRCNYQQIVFHP